MRILVTGSRDWDDVGAVAVALLSGRVIGEEVTVVHGGASGADQIANRVARNLGWKREVHPAAWRPNGIYNPQAGLLRNREMVELGADVCLAFIKNGSRGATHCAALAMEAGIPTRRYLA